MSPRPATLETVWAAIEALAAGLHQLADAIEARDAMLAEMHAALTAERPADDGMAQMARAVAALKEEVAGLRLAMSGAMIVGATAPQGNGRQ